LFKIKAIIFIFLITLFNYSYGKNITLRTYYDYNYHGVSLINKLGIFPQQELTVGDYYENDKGLQLELMFVEDKGKTYQPVFSIIYDRQELSGRVHNTKYLLGQELTIDKIAANIGGGMDSPILNREIFWFTFVGIELNFYNGESKLDDNEKVEFQYDKSFSFLCGFGMDISLSKNIPIYLSHRLTFHFTEMDRSTGKVYENGQYIQEFVPLGEDELHDNSVSLSFGIAYKFLKSD
jgi:hypothetical protein